MATAAPRLVRLLGAGRIFRRFSMRAVSSFEANLLRILHGILDRAALAQIEPLILRTQVRPPCLSRDCVELVQDALAKGCVHLLAVRGGWRNERFLRNEQAAQGRLWQRTPPEALGLEFSRNALDFLMWITAVNVADPEAPAWRRVEGVELTIGDRLLIYLAYERIRPIREAAPWLRRFAGQSLCRLAFPQDFREAPPVAADKFLPWTQGQGGCILEALQHNFAEHWIHVERSKGRIVKASEMLALGKSQEQVLDGFLGVLASAQRRDLARFLLLAARRLLEPQPPPSAWIASLDVSGLRMADRADAYRASTAFLRRLETFEGWQRHARSVSFFDEDYAASQLWKSDWEELQGDEICRRAQHLVQALDPMHAE